MGADSNAGPQGENKWTWETWGNFWKRSRPPPPVRLNSTAISWKCFARLPLMWRARLMLRYGSSKLSFRAGGGTAGIAHLGMAHPSIFLAPAGSEFQTTKHAPRICSCCKTRSGVSFSIMASTAIVAVQFRLQCLRFSLRPESPSSCANNGRRRAIK